MQIKKRWLGVFFMVCMAVSTGAFAEYRLNLHRGVTPVSQAMFGLHMMAFWICVGIAVVVFGVMFYSLIRFRKSRGVEPVPFHEHMTIEVLWAVIPFLILVAMAIPATKVLILMDDKSNPDINIKVTGYQWKWHYEYIDENIKYFSNLSTPLAQIHNEEPKGEHYLLEVDNPLVVPINKKIRFLVTANDVIHSWWVPRLGVKRDAVPGFIHESWAEIKEPGIYRGQCAELCGVNHAFMPIVVDARTQEDYDTWLAGQKSAQDQQAASANKAWTKDELMQKGQKSYLTYCAACHQASGQGLPPTFPALKGSKIATGPKDKHIQTVMNGVPNTAMQAFSHQLDDTELAAIITYERNAWGNDTGDLIQPADIKAARGGKATAPAAPAPKGTAAVPAQVEPAAKAAAPAATPPSSAAPAATSTPTPPAAAPTSTAATTEPAAAAAALTKEELMKSGEDVYLRVCAVCHKPDGSGMPPVFPALTSSAIIKGPVEGHINRVLHGVPGTAMQAFGAQLSDADLAAVITYERNAWNGGTGGLVQPAEIAKARTGSK